MFEKTIATARTGRYFILGKLSSKTRHVLVALHGYGQLASFFSQKFEEIANDQVLVVVPEAGARFYLNENYSRIGASWLTRELLHESIQDNNLFLTEILKKENLEHLSLHTFGFSQGCVTALRWMNSLPSPVQSCVLFAGFLPDGIAPLLDKNKYPLKSFIYAYGKEDEYFVGNEESYIKHLNLIPELQLVPFNTNHKVSKIEIKELYSRVFN